MDDFHKNLKLFNVGMDPQKGIDSNIESHVNLEKFFGKRTQNGWKSNQMIIWLLQIVVHC